MLRKIKDLIKSFLPRWVIEYVMRRREVRALAAVPTQKFSVAALLQKSQFVHAQVFSEHSEFDAGWDQDHAAIIDEHSPDQIGASVSPGDRKALYRVVRNFKPKRVLEFGTHIAMSTSYIAGALKSNGFGEITTVDIIDVNSEAGAWRSVGMVKPPIQIVESLGLADMVTFVATPGADFLERKTGSYDVIFLDGDHSAPAVYNEVVRALGMLNPGGLILLHDFFLNGVRLFDNLEVIHGPYLAFERLCRENPDLDVVPFSPMPWMTLPGTRNTSLAALVRR